MKTFCPVCKTNANIEYYDKGLKLVTRFLSGNNRYVCRTCKVTWRRKTADRYLDLVRKEKFK